jgi:hypothetical protein
VEAGLAFFLLQLELQLNVMVGNNATTPNPKLDAQIALVWWALLVVSTAQRMAFGFAIAKGGSPFKTTLQCGSLDGLAFKICHHAFASLFHVYFILVGFGSLFDVVIRLAQYTELTNNRNNNGRTRMYKFIEFKLSNECHMLN